MRHVSGRDLELHTFSYIADDPGVSEERWIRLVASETGVVVHTVMVSPEELLSDIDRLIQIQAEPFRSTSIYAQYRVFRLAEETGVKVMLDGQGADELFAGYRDDLPDRISGLLARGHLLTTIRLLRGLSTLPDVSPGSMLARAIGHALPRAAQDRARELTGHRLVPDWLDAGWLASQDVTLADPGRTARGSLREHRLDTVRNGLRELLRYEDRNSMATSIESRVPFLTAGLAEFAASLPDDYLVADDGAGKLVLRRSLRGIVPDPILARRDKIGFATPEAHWLRRLAPWVDQVFGSDAARTAGPLRVDVAKAEWRKMKDESRSLDAAVWRWINFIRWIDQLDVVVD
jgi:asparagine synthase (glutamine-hydrolysing)